MHYREGRPSSQDSALAADQEAPDWRAMTLEQTLELAPPREVEEHRHRVLEAHDQWRAENPRRPREFEAPAPGTYEFYKQRNEQALARNARRLERNRRAERRGRCDRPASRPRVVNKTARRVHRPRAQRASVSRDDGGSGGPGDGPCDTSPLTPYPRCLRDGRVLVVNGAPR